jgi:hypothetical protein
MIFLNGANDTLELTTSSAADIDYQINWVDVIPAASATPGSSEGKITSATTTAILAAPASGTSRQIKSIFIKNIHATTPNTISVSKDVSGTGYAISTDAILQAGEIFVYEDGLGWSIQDMLVSTLTNDLHLGYQDWTGIADPAAPSSNILRIYSKNISGRMMPKWKGPSGIDTPFQSALFGNNWVVWNPGATSGAMIGSVQTVITAGVAALPTTTNKFTSLRRSTFTAATGINLMNSLRSEAMFFRGGVAGMGGFFFQCRFGLSTWTATNRLFVGLCVDTTALLTADPSTKFNLLGFGVDTADTEISFMHNDGAGAATKDAIAGQPALASNNVYDVFIYCRPNDSTVYYRLDNISAGTTIIDSSAITELPVNTTMLIATAAIGSGATNAGAGVAALGLNRMYIETDY